MANKGSLKTHLSGKKSFGATPNDCYVFRLLLMI